MLEPIRVKLTVTSNQPENHLPDSTAVVIKMQVMSIIDDADVVTRLKEGVEFYAELSEVSQSVDVEAP